MAMGKERFARVISGHIKDLDLYRDILTYFEVLLVGHFQTEYRLADTGKEQL